VIGGVAGGWLRASVRMAARVGCVIIFSIYRPPTHGALQAASTQSCNNSAGDMHARGEASAHSFSFTEEGALSTHAPEFRSTRAPRIPRSEIAIRRKQFLHLRIVPQDLLATSNGNTGTEHSPHEPRIRVVLPLDHGIGTGSVVDARNSLAGIDKRSKFLFVEIAEKRPPSAMCTVLHEHLIESFHSQNQIGGTPMASSVLISSTSPPNSVIMSPALMFWAALTEK